MWYWKYLNKIKWFSQNCEVLRLLEFSNNFSINHIRVQFTTKNPWHKYNLFFCYSSNNTNAFFYSVKKNPWLLRAILFFFLVVEYFRYIVVHWIHELLIDFLLLSRFIFRQIFFLLWFKYLLYNSEFIWSTRECKTLKKIYGLFNLINTKLNIYQRKDPMKSLIDSMLLCLIHVPAQCRHIRGEGLKGRNFKN